MLENPLFGRRARHPPAIWECVRAPVQRGPDTDHRGAGAIRRRRTRETDYSRALPSVEGTSSPAVTFVRMYGRRKDTTRWPVLTNLAPVRIDERGKAPTMAMCRAEPACSVELPYYYWFPLRAWPPSHLRLCQVISVDTRTSSTPCASPAPARPALGGEETRLRTLTARDRIFAAPSMSPARSAPMLNTPHTSSPEKPERFMPQCCRADAAMSIGMRPATRRNSRRRQWSRDLRTARTASKTSGTPSPREPWHLVKASP